MSDISSDRLQAVAESFEEQDDWTVANVDETFGYIEFSSVSWNYRDFGDILLSHGCYASAIRETDEEAAFYISKLDVATETEIVERKRTVIFDKNGNKALASGYEPRYVVEETEEVQ